MYTAFLVCFLIGATLLICQFLLSLLGHGDGHDVHDAHGGGFHHGDSHDAHTDSDQHVSWFFGVLTFRALVSALTLFGLVGLATHEYLESPRSLFAALGAGAATLYLVAFLMRSLHGLRADGTARIDKSVGQNGTVYLAIPAQKAGAGKITLNLQNRTVECQAVTPHQALPTGAQVVVTAVVGPNTVEVVSTTASGSLSHA